MIISLWGFMGSGKTSVGNALAEREQWKHIDSDAIIELEQEMEIKDIFNIKGETYFRNLETEWLETLVQTAQSSQPPHIADLAPNRDECVRQKKETRSVPPVVITTGGGMPVRKQNRNMLQALGPCIYLHCPFSVIVERLARDTERPLWDNEQIESMRKLYNERLSLYKEADYTIDTSTKSTDEIVHEIVHVITPKK